MAYIPCNYGSSGGTTYTTTETISHQSRSFTATVGEYYFVTVDTTASTVITFTNAVSIWHVLITYSTSSYRQIFFVRATNTNVSCSTGTIASVKHVI